MAQFRKAVVTEKGLALILKTQMRQIKLEFSKIVTGSGEWTEDESLSMVTGLRHPMQEFGISAVDIVDRKTVKLATALTNEGLTEAYYMREIGIYATDPDEGDVLYSIAVTLPERSDYLPAYDGQAPVNIMLDTYQSVSDAANVTIKLDSGAYALATDFRELQDAFKDLKENVIAKYIEEHDKNPNAHAAISRASVVQMDITIPASGWEADTGGTYALHRDIALAEVTEKLIPILTLLPATGKISRACGMCTAARTLDGILRVYAAREPTADMSCSLVLLDIDGSGSAPQEKTFEAAAYTNVAFGPSPGSTGYWADTDAAHVTGAVKYEEGPSIISGNLEVSEGAHSGTTFFAKIDQ